jgi:hypothetical protein
MQLYDGRDQKLMIDYTFANITGSGWLKSNPLLAQVFGNLDSFKFNQITVNEWGKLNITLTELLWADSAVFNDITGWINNNLLRQDSNRRDNRYKKIKDLMFKELEMKLVPGMYFGGAEFDELYIGKEQNWDMILDEKVHNLKELPNWYVHPYNRPKVQMFTQK